MTRLASRFGSASLIRRDRALTNEELMRYVPSVFSEEKHTSRSDRYTYIPTITLLDNLRREGFQPFFACQTRTRDEGKREHTKHMLRLRREGQILGKEVPEIILLNSHDGSSSYQMIPGLFRFVCQNGCVCGQENMSKGRLWARSEKGHVSRTRPVTGIDGDVKLNRALWEMAEQMKKLKS